MYVCDLESHSNMCGDMQHLQIVWGMHEYFVWIKSMYIIFVDFEYYNQI